MTNGPSGGPQHSGSFNPLPLNRPVNFYIKPEKYLFAVVLWLPAFFGPEQVVTIVENIILCRHFTSKVKITLAEVTFACTLYRLIEVLLEHVDYLVF